LTNRRFCRKLQLFYRKWNLRCSLRPITLLSLTLPEHMRSPPVFSGIRVTRSLVLSVCFVDIVVCPLLLFHLVIVLSVLRYTDSDYPFGIFSLFLCPISLDCKHDSDYPFGILTVFLCPIFLNCKHDSDYPFGIFTLFSLDCKHDSDFPLVSSHSSCAYSL